MNLMYYVVNNKQLKTKDTYFKEQIEAAKESLEKNHIKISESPKRVSNTLYYLNSLPYIAENRDLLTKSFDVCKLRVNWKNIEIKKSSDVDELLPEQYGWNVITVDKEHTRNNYQNKETCWCVFNKKEKALVALKIFNSMFRTAIEQDCIDEYKKFKQNPAKRVLTFNALIPNAYDLYDLVDQDLV